MVRKKGNKRITAIIPAYNEADRIGSVLDVMTTYADFFEIIVVDDGSSDDTEKIVSQYDVIYIKNKINKGKGYSMDIGVQRAGGDVILFVDADVIGLTHDIIDSIVNPVIAGDVDMFIAMRNRKIYYLHSILVFIPLLGGERAVTKELWNKLPMYYKNRFRVEAGLNFYAEYYGNGFKYKVFKGLSQVIKEKKYGFIQGLRQRISMIANVISAQFRLQFVDIPKSIKNQRLLSLVAVQSFLLIFLGFSIILISIYFVPSDVVNYIFTSELREDPSAPFVNFLFYLTNIATTGTIMFIGFIIMFTNLFVFILTFKKLKLFLKRIENRIKSNL